VSILQNFQLKAALNDTSYFDSLSFFKVKKPISIKRLKTSSGFSQEPANPFSTAGQREESKYLGSGGTVQNRCTKVEQYGSLGSSNKIKHQH